MHLVRVALRAPGRPGEARYGDRVGVELAVGVAEARGGEHAADGPVDRVAHFAPERGDRGRPVEVRGRVEVARQEGRDALRLEPRQRRELAGEGRHAQSVLEREHLLERRAVAHEVRAVGVGRQVHVHERHDAAGRDLGEDVDAVAAGRIDQGVTRRDLHPLARVEAERIGDRARVVLALLEAEVIERLLFSLLGISPKSSPRLHLHHECDARPQIP